MQRHRHQYFIRFLNRIEREVPAGKEVHVILDNYAAHKKDNLQNGLLAIRARHSTSHRLRLMAPCRRGLLRKTYAARLKNGVFHSVVDLQAAINRFIREYNDTDPKPFVWSANLTPSSPLKPRVPNEINEAKF